MSTPMNDILITRERPKGGGLSVVSVGGGRLCVRELIAVLQNCPDQHAFVVIRDSPEIKIGCDVRTLDSVTTRQDPTVLLNFSKSRGWD
jgi:hypothetical protein